MMKKQLLDGMWSGMNERTREQYAFRVPGFVQKDLMEQGRIPDEYDTLFESEAEWVEHDDWTYRRTFELSGELLDCEALDLVFEGVDTFAEVSLNGVVIGNTENMFVRHRFSIKSVAKAENELVVRIFSPTAVLKEKEREFGEPLQLWNGISARLFGRKAQYGYGWDWGPRLATAGIHKSVRVEGYDRFRIGRPSYEITHLSDRKALLNARVPVTRVCAGPEEAEIVYRLYDGNAVCAEQREKTVLRPGTVMYEAALEIREPKRWYPAGYGEQPLYRLEVTVAAAQFEDTASCTVGLRDVRLDMPYDGQGRKFVFRVNDVPVLCKGVNWIPLTLFPGLDSAEDYRRETDAVLDANMNMIRVWGGGYYENHDFYAECDRKGIMVWQDFMFACGDYPDDDGFCEQVRREAAFVVQEYGYHPSIVLWCGNNENQVFVERSRAKRKHGYGEKLYFEIMPEVCRQDRLRPYWPASPYSLTFDHNKYEGQYGDLHSWGVWGEGKPYEEYADVHGRFISEFGMQSYPSLHVLNKAARDADLRDARLAAMQKFPHGLQKLMFYTVGDYRLPADKSGFVYVNQLMQANALRLGVEHWLSRMPDTSGALVWQWNDVWPSISWSLVDYGKVPKPAFYYLKRCFQSPNAFLKPSSSGQKAEVVLVHDRGDFSGRVEVVFYDIVEETALKTVEMPAAGQGYRSSKIGEVETNGFDPARTVVFVRLYGQGGLLARHSYLLGKPCDLRLKPAELRVDTEVREDGTLKCSVRSDVFAKDVRIVDGPALLSDHYFDLCPGETREILIEDWHSSAALPNGAVFPELSPFCLNQVRYVNYV